MHTAEPSVPEPSASGVEGAVGKMERYKSPGVDQIPAELIQAGVEALRLEIHKLKLIWNKRIASPVESQLWYLFTKRAIKLTSNYRGISLLSTSYKILPNIFLCRLTPHADEINEDR
jgi:hypothetical protein